MPSKRTVSDLQLTQARNDCWQLFGRDIPSWQMLLTMKVIIERYRKGSAAHQWLLAARDALELHRAYADLVADNGPYEFFFTMRAAAEMADDALLESAEFMFLMLNRALFGHKAERGAALDGFVSLERQDRWGKSALPHFHAVLRCTSLVRGKVNRDEIAKALDSGNRPKTGNHAEVFDYPSGVHITDADGGGTGTILSSYLVKQVSPVGSANTSLPGAKLYQLTSGRLGELA